KQGNRNPYIDNPLYVTAVWYPHLLSADKPELVEFKIYPNPAPKNTVFITSKQKIDLISIYNLEGKLVQKISNPLFNDEVFTIHHLKTGTYIIQLKSGNFVVSEKVIIK